MPLFTVNTASEGDTFVVRITGELDLFECPRLVWALREAEATHAPRILLDLEGLTFIDAAGLGVLVAAWRRSLTNGNRLRVTQGMGDVASMFCLTALDTRLPLIPSVSGE
jgi:anti-sigma B factor antagonist